MTTGSEENPSSRGAKQKREFWGPNTAHAAQGQSHTKAVPSGHMIVAEVWRGDIRECVHVAHVVETDHRGQVIRAWGDADFVTSLRSSAKPVQAIPIMAELPDDELAICCASHPGQTDHVDLVLKVLNRSGARESDLVCGPVTHGCSGNHAGLMLAATKVTGSFRGYQLPTHPIQKELRVLIETLSQSHRMYDGPDGCGIPTYGLTLTEMARLFAALPAGILRVMIDNPTLIGAQDWIDVRVMKATRRIVAKTGAEGLLCLALDGRGIAIKVADGSTRPLSHITLHVLYEAGWISEEERNQLCLPGDIRITEG